MFGRLNIESIRYPMTATAIKLLMVKLTIIAAHAGRKLSISGGDKNGKNSHR